MKGATAQIANNAGAVVADANKEHSNQLTSSASSTSNDAGASSAATRAVNKPRSLLVSYNQTWKAAHNHFQRYSDVKPREERRPTVIDLANQPHVMQKVKGWKIYHMTAQIEDMVSARHRKRDT